MLWCFDLVKFTTYLSLSVIQAESRALLRLIRAHHSAYLSLSRLTVFELYTITDFVDAIDTGVKPLASLVQEQVTEMAMQIMMMHQTAERKGKPELRCSAVKIWARLVRMIKFSKPRTADWESGLLGE